jgi:CAAX protease family protein
LTSAHPDPDSRALGKAIGWSIAFVLLGLGASLSLISLWAIAAHGDMRRGLTALLVPGPEQVLVVGLSQLVGFIFATWVVGIRTLQMPLSQLRWAPARVGARGFGAGLTLGAAAAAVALVAAVLATDSHWTRDTGGWPDYLAQVAKTFLVLAPAALSEEVIFRGVPLVLMAAAVGRGSALVVVAGLVFALFHGLNPGVTALALGNIALAGIFLGVAFYAPGGLWTAFGAHLGWNTTLAALDAPVSGLPFDIPMLDYLAGEPVWLSGGRFGPEGGLMATVAITGALLVALRWTRKERG